MDDLKYNHDQSRQSEESWSEQLINWIAIHREQLAIVYYEAPRAAFILSIFPLLSVLIGIGFQLSEQGQEFLIELGELIRGNPSVFDVPRLIWFCFATLIWLAMLWIPARYVIFSPVRGAIPVVMSESLRNSAVYASFAYSLPRRLFVFGASGLLTAIWLGADGLSRSVDDLLLILLGFPLAYYLIVSPPLHNVRRPLWLLLAGIVVSIVPVAVIVVEIGSNFQSAEVLAISVVLLGPYLLLVLIRNPKIQTGILACALLAITIAIPNSFSVLLLVLFVCAIARLSRWFDTNVLGCATNTLVRSPHSYWYRLNLIGVCIGGAIVLFLIGAFAIEPVRVGRTIGAPAIVLLALGSWSLLGTLLFVAIPQKLNLPPVPWIPFIFAIAFSPWNNNHDIRNVAHLNTPNQQSLAVAFDAWRSADDRISENRPIFVVAASGGGLRAAYWTARYLAELDDRTCGVFGRNIFAISGVSGGSLGAAAYVSALRLLRDRGETIDSPECYKFEPDKRPRTRSQLVIDFLSGDFLSPTVGSMLFPDTLQRFMPKMVNWGDRGVALADAWSARWREVANADDFNRSFMSMYDGKEGQPGQSDLPFLFFNSTRVQDGKRVITAPLGFSPHDAYLLFERGLYVDGITLAAAVLNSARFTYVSPPGTYYGWRDSGLFREGGILSISGTVKRGDLVDGGYFENSGAATVLEIVDGIAEKYPTSIDRVHVILIENSPDSKSINCQTGSAPLIHNTIKQWSPLPETLTPLLTLLETRSARATLHQQQVRERFKCEKTIQVFFGDVETTSSDRRVNRDPALGWFLSATSRKKMDTAATEMAKRFPITYRPCPNFRKKPPEFKCPIPIIGTLEWSECLGMCTSTFLKIGKIGKIDKMDHANQRFNLRLD